MMLHGTSDSGALRYTLGPIGLLAALTLLAVSAVMNFRFGFSLGKTPEDGQLYGWASVASDLFKAISPFFFFAAWRTRMWAVFLAGLTVWGVTTAYALTGAFGHAALNRLDTAGQRVLASDTYKDLRTDKKRYEDQISWLPPHRAAAAVRADMEAVKAQRLWSTTSECQETAGKSAREFCSGYHKLDAELGNALKADDLNKKIEDIAGKLSKSTTASVMTEADPQAGIIARVSKWELGSVQLALAILIVLLLEAGSGLGPYIALSYMFGSSQREDSIIDAKFEDVQSLPAATQAAPSLPAPAETVPETAPAVADTPSAPEPEQPSTEPVATPLRNPLPGSEAALAEIGFPVGKTLTGPKRPKLSPEEAAPRFKVYLQAFDLVRDPLTDQDMTRLYAGFCEADHREPTYEKAMRSVLAKQRGVKTWKARTGDKRQARWEIARGKYPKPAKPSDPEPAPPKQEGGRLLSFIPRPLAEPAHEPAADMSSETPRPETHGVETAERRHIAQCAEIPAGNKRGFLGTNIPGREHPALLRAVAHQMRREGRNKKQRGSRNGRRAA